MPLQSSRYHWADDWVSSVGRFFVNFHYLFICLVTYVVLAIITWGYLCGRFDLKIGTAIAYTLATGGDPYSQPKTAELGWVCWLWFYCFHVLSWLVVPVLIATAIQAAYLTSEERKRQAEQVIIEEFKEIGKTLKVPDDKLSDFAIGRFVTLKQKIESRSSLTN